MKLAFTILAVSIGLLSVAAGGAKVALVPEEAAFLAQFGFSDLATRAFGIVQVLAGVLLVVPATRMPGALLAAAGFAVSAALVFSDGNAAFGGVSLIPVALALLIAYRVRADRSPDHPPSVTHEL